MEGKLSENHFQNMRKLVAELRANPGGLWVREIARRTGIHMETARRLIDRHPQVFREYADFTAYRINLKIIKLTDARIDENNFMKFIATRPALTNEGISQTKV